MIYEKCRTCKYVCRCCSSHFIESRPRCSECANNRNEFTPAIQIVYCPLDGQKIIHPLYNNHGCLIKEK